MSELKANISALIEAAEPGQVWVPTDFTQLGKRDAIDKTLQRMVQAGELRPIDRGLYDKPKLSGLTKWPTTPDYRAVMEAIARRDQLHRLVDGMTAANDLGLTDAVPARVTSPSIPTLAAAQFSWTTSPLNSSRRRPAACIGLGVRPCASYRHCTG